MVEQPLDLVFVLGCGRSGSTLVERVIHETFDVTAVGEVTYIWQKGLLRNENCSCGQPFRACPFWTEVIKDAFGQVTENDAVCFDNAFRDARGHLTNWSTLGGRFPAPSGMFREIASALYKSATRIGGGRPILDSSKLPAFAAAVWHSDLGSFSGLHLFRDACGNVQSLRTPKRRPHARSESDAEMHPSRSVLHAVGRWSILNWQARQLANELSDNCGTISYEHFCTDPDRHLFAFQNGFGLRMRRGNANDAWHSVSGNPMRFDPGSTRIDLDEQWKQQMSYSDRLVTRTITYLEQHVLESAAERWLREKSPIAAPIPAAAAA